MQARSARIVTIGVASVLAFVLACGSSHGVRGDGGLPGDGTLPPDGFLPDGPLCGSAACGGDACGSGSACGQPVSCGMCRYDATAIASSFYRIRVATGSGAAPPVAVTDGTVLATRGSSGWTTEQVTDSGGSPIAGQLAAFALASDGTRWLAYVNVAGGAVTVAHGSAAAGWTTDTIGTSLIGDPTARLVIAPDGTAFVAFYGSAAGVQSGIVLARSSGSAGAPWTLTTIVPYGPLLDDFDMAVDPAGGGQDLAFAWQTSSVQYATASSAGVAGTVETIDAAASASTGDAISLAFDAAGLPHVAYRHDAPLDRGAYHVVRTGGAWTSEQIGGTYGTSTTMQVTAAPGGGVAILYNDDDGVLLAQHANGVWLTQPVYSSSCIGSAALANVAGQLEVIHDCDGSIVELVRDGLYPADYATTCAHAAAALCTAACSCSSSCCIDESHGQTCDDPEANCENQAYIALCGDPSRDPNAIYQCDSAIGMPACGTDSAITAPAECMWP